MTTIILVAFVTAASLYLIVSPFFSGTRPLPASKREMNLLLEEKENALREIKEIEFDYLTGKLSEEDYADLLALYKRKALTVLEAIERSEDDAMEDRLALLQREVRADLRKLREKRHA